MSLRLVSSSSLLGRTARLYKLPATRYSTMSAPRKFEWLVVVPDVPGTLAKRMEVRATHFADLKRFDATGNLKMGGALLEEIPADDEPSSLKINGSTLVVEATSKEEIMEILKGDVYTREGVWDLEKVQMWPFKCALRSAMN
ncbi:hypothetical protein RB601_002362 [Gaeumannomyces tritici]